VLRRFFLFFFSPFLPVSYILALFLQTEKQITNSNTLTMEEKNVNIEKKNDASKEQPKKTNRTWEAAKRLKGSLIVNDPTFLL